MKKRNVIISPTKSHTNQNYLVKFRGSGSKQDEALVVIGQNIDEVIFTIIWSFKCFFKHWNSLFHNPCIHFIKISWRDKILTCIVAIDRQCVQRGKITTNIFIIVIWFLNWYLISQQKVNYAKLREIIWNLIIEVVTKYKIVICDRTSKGKTFLNFKPRSHNV